MAQAGEAADCVQMAGDFADHFFGFPEVEQETIERLATWRGSCASQPPGGLGNVLALCQARSPDGSHVFYWRKTGIEAETSGYEICGQA